MDPEETAKFMSVPELAKVLKISKTSAYDLVKSGNTPFIVLKPLPKRIIIPVNSFNSWYESLNVVKGEEDANK